MDALIQLKTTPTLLMTLALLCFGFSPTAKALLPAPSPDGSYPGGNTAEGVNALHDVNTAVGINNTAVGANALTHDTTGYSNVAVGEAALANNTTGNFNMAIGTEALRDNNGTFNLAIGFRVLFMNTTGSRLTGIGAAALRNNTTASDNTAIGSNALRENTTAGFNTAIGADALQDNRTGSSNTAVGADALRKNAIGDYNTAIGADALVNNTVGCCNTATGFEALLRANGNGSTAYGFGALHFNTSGSSNTAVGSGALASNTTGDHNTAVGESALIDNIAGHDNTAIGSGAGVGMTGSGNVCIGSEVFGVASENNTTRIGNIYSSVASGRAVYVNSDNKIGTLASTRRVKNDIKPMNKASEAVLALKPVSFRYKKEIDASGTLQFGLIAEDVADINADLVTRDSEGKPETVRYEAVNAMLLNEFLKEHKKTEKLEVTVASLIATVKEQAAQIQKVTAQLEASKPAPQVVNNP